MKAIYALVPVLLIAGFGAFYVFWSAKKEQQFVAGREGAGANQSREDLYSGKEFVGRNGTKEAEADISHRTPKWVLYGKTGGDIEERTAIFKQRFGIELDPLAGCIVSEPLVSFASAYNDVIRKHIAVKFGATAFEDADREAMRMWEEKRLTRR